MRSVHCLVRICHSTTFLMRLEEFIHKMHFFLPLFALTLFCTNQKSPQASEKNVFPSLYHIYFHHSFLMLYFKMCIKGVIGCKIVFTSCLKINVCTHPSYNDENPPSDFFSNSYFKFSNQAVLRFLSE